MHEELEKAVTELSNALDQAGAPFEQRAPLIDRLLKAAAAYGKDLGSRDKEYALSVAEADIAMLLNARKDRGKLVLAARNLCTRFE